MTLKGGETGLRGGDTKILKRGNMLGQGVGVLKRGTGTTLQTMARNVFFKLKTSS